MSRSRTGAICAAAALTLGLLAGCSSTLDTDKLQQTIQADLSKGIPAGTQVSVTCESADIKSGSQSTCTANLGSQTLTYDVTQNDDQGNVTYKRTSAIIDLDKAQTTISGQLAEQLGGDWTVTCKPDAAGSDRVYVVAVDETFTCAAEGTNGDGEAQSGNLNVTVKDLEGNVDWEAAS